MGFVEGLDGEVPFIGEGVSVSFADGSDVLALWGLVEVLDQ